ncbi:hypothetical protein M422DRAFT_244859 [Sphaerobolus stellatus SS14]|nr:hypothetical protein M422DRAFT_244859 [Sphaerobolus stellatus SS14]
MSTISIPEWTQEHFYLIVGNYTHMAALDSAVSVTALIFTGTVMAITAYLAWTSRKQLQNMFGTRQYLTVILLQQGVIHFFIIFTWNLGDSISSKVLNPFLRGFDIGLENSVSVILICQFILQLRKFNTRVQTVPSVHITSTTPGIQGRLQCIHETLIEEFGHYGIEYDLETENDMAELKGNTAPFADIATESGQSQAPKSRTPQPQPIMSSTTTISTGVQVEDIPLNTTLISDTAQGKYCVESVGVQSVASGTDYDLNQDPEPPRDPSPPRDDRIFNQTS